MTTARTEPTDGFLDREFASFREARLRARKAKTEDALEHRHAKAAEPEPGPAAEAGAPPAQEDAFFGTSTHERTSIRARARDVRSTAMLEVMLDDLDGDVAATRTGPRVSDAPPTAAAPATPTQAPPVPPVRDEDGTRAMIRATTRADVAAEDSCSDPEFEAFRAARRSGKPDSGRLRKPDGRPDSGRLHKPEPRRPDGGAVEGHCSDPEFERFRAARQAGEAPPRRADSGRLRKPEPPPSAIEQLLEVTLPEPTVAPEVASTPTAEPPTAAEEPATVFFGTSVHERAVVRARVVGESPDPDEPATGRRAPPPPLPERPSP